jgi:ribonuclease P protein component
MRLLKRAEYEAVYGAGQRRSSPQFSIFFRARSGLANETMGQEPARQGSNSNTSAEGLPVPASPAGDRQASASRFGISVKKALGGAVTRNRIRRRIREILRRHRTEIPTGWDIVIHPKATVARAEFAPLEAELVRLLRSVQNSGPKP